MRLKSRLLLVGLVAGATALLGAAPAGAAKASFTRIQGFKAPGTPKALNKVGILKVGPKRAKNILVLEPGTSASAAYFRPLADDILAKVNKRARGRALRLWQVWSVERRENLLEDQSRLDMFKRGEITPEQLFQYYLEWLTDNDIATHLHPVADANVPFARQWGMNVAMQDLRRVILLAHKRGRHVVLGGHSLGGSMTTAYATWNFGGKAGARDLSGLVFIDGGSGAGQAPSATEAQQSLDELQTSSPFLDLVGLGLPWSAGVFNLVGSSLAHDDPNTLSPLQDWPVLPSDLKPPVDATNEAGYGYALDTETGPANLMLVQVHAGRLAASGDPRRWDPAGEITPIHRVAAMFQGSGLKGLDGTSWYHPRRLSIDSAAVNGGIKNPAQKVLNVHATHGHDLNLPIYAFGAALGDGRVLDAARALARQSGIPKRMLTLVDRAATYAHIDPLSAFPANAFVKKLIGFLHKTQARHRRR
jgi:hypothetical protein